MFDDESTEPNFQIRVEWMSMTLRESGRPVTATDQHRQTRVDEIIHNNRHVKQHEIETQLRISRENWIIENVVLVGCHDNEPKGCRKDICLELLTRYVDRAMDFL